VIRKRHIISRSEAETHAAGRELAAELSDTLLIAISGDLGSGKTALVRGICEHEGCASQVSSPTFTIVNEYSGRRPVLHVDLYRLTSIQDMLDIGLDELFASGALLLIEWAERAFPLLPYPRIEVAASHGADENTREYTFRFSTRDSESILFEPREFIRSHP
jgi:tRNA threonylcarbamoyladenosine biosynthesis protein TsaE